MSYSLGTASGRIDLTYTGGAAVKRAQADVLSLEKMLGAAGLSMGNLGKAAAIGVGGALVAGFAVAVKSAATFEKQLSAIEAVSGANASQMDQMREKALQLGADTSFSASEAASAMEELVKAGLSVEEVLGGAADAAVSLAAAGGLGIAEAATIASNAMNQFNLQASQLPGVADTIAGAANASAIDVTDLGMSLKQVGAVANLAGLSFEDTATAIALMGNAGIKGSDAGTSLKTMLQNLQPQTQKQIDLFNQLGITTEDGSNRFFDAQGNVKSYAQVAGVLGEALEGMGAKQKLATLETMFGTDAIRAAAIAADEGAKGVRTMAEEMGKMTAADVAAKRMDNLAGSFEELGGSIETAFIRAGSSSLVVIRSIVDSLTSGVNAATNFGVSLAEKAGPGLDALGGTVMNIIAIIKDMASAFDGAGSSIAGLALDGLIGIFNAVASVLETVTGLFRDQGEALLILGGAYLVLANGGVAKLAAQLGYLVVYGIYKAVMGFDALYRGTITAGAGLSGLAAKAKAAVAALGAVAVIVGAVSAWNSYKRSIEDVEKAMDEARETMKSGTLPELVEQRNEMAKLNAEHTSLADRIRGDNAFETFGKSVVFFGKQLGTLDFEEYGAGIRAFSNEAASADGLREMETYINQTSDATLSLARGLGDISGKEFYELSNAVQKMDPSAIQRVQAMLEGYKGALSQVGISQTDFTNAFKEMKGGDPGAFNGIIASIEAVRTNFGRTAAAADQAKGAFAQFGSSAKSTAEAADDLKAALDSLFGVELNADQATIQWQQSLIDLRKQLSSTGGVLKGNTQAALNNRQAIIDSARGILDRIDAEARAGASAKRLGNILQNGRKDLVANAVAAGANKREVEKLIATYNMTPKKIRTLVEAAGADAEKAKMERLINTYKLTPKQVRSIVEAAGAETAKQKVDALRAAIAALRDKSVTITTTHVTNQVTVHKVRGVDGGRYIQADGGVHPDGIASYASGGIRSLSAGIYNGRRIMFAEPGTGGEAFIPLAPHKRRRSEVLLHQVASIFGGQFVKMADGGFNNLAQSLGRTRVSGDSSSVASVQMVAFSPSSPSLAGIKVHGNLELRNSGAYLRGVASEVYDDGSGFDTTIGRMR